MAVTFTNSDEIFTNLTNKLGAFCIEVTGRQVVEADENIIPRVEGEFILVDLSDAEQIDWHDNEWIDETGFYCATHNYQVTYTLTAYRGKPQACLAKVLQAMNLPFIYDKYFADTFAAHSSSSSISRMRVPMNAQFYENRARVQIIFNVKFAERDTGNLTDLERIEMNVSVGGQGGEPLDDFPVVVDISETNTG